MFVPGESLEHLRDRRQAGPVGHVQVEHEHVRLVAEHGARRGVDVARLGDDLEILLGVEQHLEAAAHDLVVVGDDDCDRGAVSSLTIPA